VWVCHRAMWAQGLERSGLRCARAGKASKIRGEGWQWTRAGVGGRVWQRALGSWLWEDRERQKRQLELNGHQQIGPIDPSRTRLLPSCPASATYVNRLSSRFSKQRVVWCTVLD
jgi:hypothetical protein